MGKFEGGKKLCKRKTQMNSMVMCFDRMLMMFITRMSTDGLTCWISDI